MAFFEGVWNTGIPASVSPDILAGITQVTINDYLKGHRRYDEDKYKFSRAFTGEKQSKFSVDATVETALRIELPPFPRTDEALVKFAEFPVQAFRNSPESPNMVKIFADNNTLLFKWTTAAGKSFDHTVKNVKFQLDAEVDIVTDGSRHSLKFLVKTLSIDQADYKKMLDVWAKAEPTCEEKITALFLSMLQVIAGQIAGRLEETVEVPVIDMGKIRLYAAALALTNKTVVLGASGDISGHVRRINAEKMAYMMRVEQGFDNDVHRLGGITALIFPAKVVARARELDPQAAEMLLLRSAVRNDQEIWRDLVETRAVLDSLPNRGPHPKGKALKGKAARGQIGIGIGLAEKLLQALASSAINVNERNCTDEKSAGIIKGRACANVHVWNPIITIGSGGLQGQVNVDVWAGIEYFVKQFWKCSWSWDGPHQIGVGITGTPRVTLRTVKVDEGLSIDARFDLKDVALKTGISELIDKIVGALSKLFIAVLQVIFNAIAGLLRLVVVPVKIAIPGQNTAVKLGTFDTSLYTRNAFRYLAVDCAATPAPA